MLEHLKGLTALQTLNLMGTKVTDAGLEHLKKCLLNVEIQMGADVMQIPPSARPRRREN